MEELIGKTLGAYEIKEKIGEGGMAYVFKAYQPALDRFVAIKILSPRLVNEPGFTERFQREAHAVAHLNHPNILQVHDFGLQDNYYYIVMRYVANSLTMETLMRRDAPVDQLIEYAIQVAEALNYAHEHGIIHRDVKPSNILIDNQWALLSDFGLVKQTRGDGRHLTAAGKQGLGTPAYMSPEQAKGASIDHRADIYALGIILYQILTGTIPHDAPTPLAIIAKRVTEPVLPLRQLKPEISESLEQVALRALVSEPDYRYNSATQFAMSLRQAQRDANSPGPLTTTQFLPDPNLVTVAARSKYLNPKFVWSIATVIVLGLFLLILSLVGGELSGLVRSTTPPDTPGNVEAALAAESAFSTDTPVSPTATLASNLAGASIAVTEAEVEVWSGPGESYELLGYLPTGARVEINSRDQSGEWWHIKTSLSPAGSGWIRNSNNLTGMTDIDSVPIALAPPTSSPTPTSKPPSPTTTPTATATPEPTATVTPAQPAPAEAQVIPRPSPMAALPTGEFLLLKPVSLDEPSYGLTEFEWQWFGSLAENQGFEVRVWQADEPPTGVHDAVLDNRQGKIQAVGNQMYRLVVDITEAPGVRQRRGEFNWSVVLVQIDPEYKDLGLQAPPARLRFEPPGASGGGGGDEGGGGGGAFN